MEKNTLRHVPELKSFWVILLQLLARKEACSPQGPLTYVCVGGWDGAMTIAC